MSIARYGGFNHAGISYYHQAGLTTSRSRADSAQAGCANINNNSARTTRMG